MTKKKEEEMKDRKVCEQCGLIHETPLAPGESKADDLKMIVLSAAGIGLIVLIWIWVFKWGVPLVKHLSGG
jgi:hypothetical protein